MWTRSLLKKNAWDNLKGYYWPALGVTFVAGIMGANGGGGFGGGGGGNFNNLTNSGSSSGSGSASDMDPALVAGIAIGVLVVVLIAMAISIAYVCFVGMPAKCGECKYFVTARNGDQNFGHLFDNFKGGNYMPTVKAMFSYYIEIFLWSLLFIIPGVIKSYEYALVPYLIAENPRLDIKRAKEISKQTMDGEKINYWVLQLSFIGWYMLGALACGVGTLFVQPYQFATDAEFYMCMRAKMLSFGYTTEEELTGGFYNGFGGGNPDNSSFNGQYNEPNFNSNAYTVPNDPYQSAQNTGYQNANPNPNPNPNPGYQNPNDQYGGAMPGVDLTKPADDPAPSNDFNTDSILNNDYNNNHNNDFNNPYNQ